MREGGNGDMSDLISRNMVLNYMARNPHTSNAELYKMICDFPTAYDVDKVVKKLDRASEHYECEQQGREDVYMVDLTDAIEIVKDGGVE